jgi:hypothetical protein
MGWKVENFLVTTTEMVFLRKQDNRSVKLATSLLYISTPLKFPLSQCLDTAAELPSLRMGINKQELDIHTQLCARIFSVAVTPSELNSGVLSASTNRHVCPYI